MFRAAALATFTFLAVVSGQQVGTQQAEVHPTLSSQQCTTSGGCKTLNTKVVLDANWRWVHTTSGYTNCYTGNEWDTSLCPDGATCAANCALDGADYQGTYGITSTGTALTLKFVTGSNVGSRVYLMQDDSTYQLLKLLNQEFTFDVDMSNLPCGLNGALYLSQMDADGGMARFPTNKAGAKYGTGYCDSQCPKDIKFIDGEVSFRKFPYSHSMLTGPHARLTSKAGTPQAPTPGPAATELAVRRWISGRRTTMLPLSLLTPARWMSRLAAPVLTVPETPVFATVMVVTSTRSAWATRLSSARE